MKRCAIVGGGISGLATAYYLQKKSPGVQIDLYEAEPRLGGVICSETVAGFVIDGGPDSFLTQKSAGLELCAELGLAGDLVGSNDTARKTFLLHQGELKLFPDGFFLMVPTSLKTLAFTPFLSWPGKMAALKDLFSTAEKRDCSVAEFVEERFGPEILQNIAEPLISGVYGSDVRRLSLQTALPQIWELQKKGSLILNLLRRPATNGSKPSLFTTLRDGMETLIHALQAHCKEVRWRCSQPVAEVVKKDGVWRIGEESYDVLVIAASGSPQIRTGNGQRIVDMLHSIRRNSAVVISLGFENLHCNGFGWLVPASERRTVLACTYVQNKFSGHVPQGRALARVFIGGKQALQWIDRGDEEIVQEVKSELRRIAGIREEPLFSRVFRWKNAMPEYVVGHAEKITALSELSNLESNLFLTGNLFAGVGVPDCIRHAKETAEKISSSRPL